MSDIFNDFFDEMEWTELICRVPGELAVNAIKRRIRSADDFVDFFTYAAVEKDTAKCKALVNHINEVTSRYDNISTVLDTVGEKWHPTLYGYLNDSNKTRLSEEGYNALSIKFHFNLLKKDDVEGLRTVVDRIEQQAEPTPSQILSVLGKVTADGFQQVVDKCLRSKHPVVRASVLSVADNNKFKTLTDTQKMIGLKAFAKIPMKDESIKSANKLDFKLFQNMKPLERLLALEKYLSMFPVYQQFSVFDPIPTEEDMENFVFAGCFQYYDLVKSIMNKYKAITQESSESKA